MSLVPIVICGLISGILITYFSDVLPVSRRFSQPLCKKCGHAFSTIDFLAFHDCPKCSEKRSFRSIIILALTLITSILVFYFPFSKLNFWATIPLLIFLGTILVIDFEHRLVLFQTSLFGFAFLFLYGSLLHGLSATLLGGLGGFSIMFAFYVLGIVFTKIVGKIKNQDIDEVAFGFGDVCVGTMLGLLTGWPGIFGAIIISMLIFVVFSVIYLIVLIATKRYRAFATTLPFTFFLIIGAVAIFYL